MFTLSDEGWEDDVVRLRDAIASIAALEVEQTFETLLRDSARAETCVRELAVGMQNAQRDSLRGTVRGLVSRIADEGPTGDSKAALSALAAGDTRRAEARFEQILSRASGDAESRDKPEQARREAASAARTRRESCTHPRHRQSGEVLPSVHDARSRGFRDLAAARICLSYPGRQRGGDRGILACRRYRSRRSSRTRRGGGAQRPRPSGLAERCAGRGIRALSLGRAARDGARECIAGRSTRAT